MKITSKTVAITVVAAIACTILVTGGLSQPLTAQQGPSGPSAASPVTHVHYHYHYFNPASPDANLISGYAPSTAWNYGNMAAVGASVQPWKQNWGHLGFTGYLGQHGGGVMITPDSFPVFTGLVVNTVTPGGTAAKLGLVPGDFITKINGVTVDTYKQVTLLFDQTEQNPKAPLTLEVWNPHTRRTQTLTTSTKN